MSTRTLEINRIPAVNSHGQLYTIVESTVQMEVQVMRGTTIWVNKGTYFRALNLGPVSRISESEFEAFLTGEKLKCT